MLKLFRKFSSHASRWVGSPYAFAIAVIVVVIWGCSGPAFGYSDTWQLVINTSTTIVTFLMVFLIQNTQNRDTQEIHLKLDELIRSNRHARNRMIDLEQMSDQELQMLHQEICQHHEEASQQIEKRRHRRHTPKL
jgi:low affinity Fe/Cu permease